MKARTGRLGALRALPLGVLLAACAAQTNDGGGGPVPRPAMDPYGAAKAADGAAAGVLYRPSPARRYAFERCDSLTLQLPGGATQLQQFERIAFLTVTVDARAVTVPGTDAYQVTVQLDSLRQSGVAISPDSLRQADGTRWTATLTPDGRLEDLRADRTSSIGDQFAGTLIALFPVLPREGAREGGTWVDTTERRLKADAFDATERAITTYRALGTNRMPGTSGRAITIETATRFERTGQGAQSPQQMEMTSQGTRRATYQFSIDGAVLSAEGADSAQMTITVPELGQTVPVSQQAKWRIRGLGMGS